MDTFHDLTVGLPGTKSYAEAIALVKRIVQESAGFPEMKPGEDELMVLTRRAAKSLDGISGGERVRKIYRPRVSGENSALSPELETSGMADGLSPVEDKKAHHAYMPYSEIPTWWFQRIQQTRGKGETRSSRAYFEAIHVLAYILFMYTGTARFSGSVLWMNSNAICKLHCITKTDYVKAIRYLEAERYIHRIVIRGFVPWAPRAKGVYTFAVPRLSKVRASNKPSAPRKKSQEPIDPLDGLGDL